MPLTTLSSRQAVDMRIDGTSYADATGRVMDWARRGESRSICVATVHMVMESHDNPEFREVVNGADLVTPDGMPLVWALRLQGVGGATRVYGPHLTLHVLEAAQREGIPVGFYGGSPAVLRALLDEVARRFPAVKVAYAFAPPFRPLNAEEDSRIVDEMERSGARILFVGIGCPKQERWMSEHRGRVRAVMLGVGAAFDFIAGAKPQAPLWMQNHGLEWLFRLICEPRRLGWRYLKHNPRFVGLMIVQLLRDRTAMARRGLARGQARRQSS